MHRVVERLLKKLSLTHGSLPANPKLWDTFLERISRAIENMDQDRYLLERSLAISSREMQELYENLRRSSEQELHQAHRELSQAHEKLRSHVENSPLAVVEWDENFHVQYWSAQAQKIFGWSAEEILGKNFKKSQWVYEEDVEKVNRVMKDLLSGREPRSVNRNRNYRKDGSIATCEWYNSALFDNEGNLISILSLVKDVTERQLAEIELRRAKEAAEAATVAKSQFLANMSHEIRTPLNGIIGYTDRLLREELSGRQLKYARTISTASKSLLTLVNDILDLSKIESGKMKVEKVDVDIHHLLLRIDSLMRPQAMEKNLCFGIQLETDIPTRIQTDPVRLTQCLVNLINNAIKFTTNGGVFVNIRADESKSSLRFDVKDTGIGIPEDKQEVIFESFAQADGSTTRRFGGTGLGLSITRNLINLLGGQIAMNSRPGLGSTFSLSLPAGTDPHKQTLLSKTQNIVSLDHEDPEPSKPGELPRFAGRVLVAEDNEINQELVRMYLQDMTIDVDVVENGRKAVEQALETTYDLILMDMQMPEMNGHQAVQELRQHGCFTPVAALTANAMEGDRQKCFEAGCCAYLSKPLHVQKLVSVLRRHLPMAKDDQPLRSDRESTPLPQTSDTEVNPIDIEKLNAYCMGRPDFMERILQKFERQLELFLQEIQCSLGDSKALAGLAHKLNGAAANLGADQISSAAHELELTAYSGDADIIRQSTKRLLREIDRFRDNIPLFTPLSRRERLSGTQPGGT